MARLVGAGGYALCGFCDAGLQAVGTHGDEREAAARVDRDAEGVVEPGIGGKAVAEAFGAASERGRLPSGNVDTAHPVVR